MRTGPELVRASSPYARENAAQSWRLLATTTLVYATFVAIAAAAPGSGSAAALSSVVVVFM